MVHLWAWSSSISSSAIRPDERARRGIDVLDTLIAVERHSADRKRSAYAIEISHMRLLTPMASRFSSIVSAETGPANVDIPTMVPFEVFHAPMAIFGSNARRCSCESEQTSPLSFEWFPFLRTLSWSCRRKRQRRES
jgi:hypothetical protein